IHSSRPGQLQSIDNITAAAQQMRASGFLPGLADADRILGNENTPGSLEFIIPRAVADIKGLRINLSEARGPSAVAIRSVAEDVFQEMSTMFNTGRSQIANIGADYEGNFTVMAKRLGGEALQQYKEFDGRTKDITESAESPLVKLWRTVSWIRGLAASLVSDVADKTNRTLDRTRALKAAVEDMSRRHGPRLEQEIRAQLDKEIKEVRAVPAVDVGSPEAAIEANTQRMMADLDRKTSIKRQEMDAKAKGTSRKVASALLASEMAMRGRSREAQESAKKALSGFEHDLLKQREMVRNDLLQGVKSARNSEKELEWLARDEASQAASYKARMNATLGTFNRVAGAISADAVGGFSKESKLLSSKGGAEEERLSAMVRLIEDGLLKSEKEKDIKIESVENVTKGTFEGNKRFAGAISSSNDGVMALTRAQASNAATAELNDIHTEERIVGEDAARVKEELRRSEALVNSSEAAMMAKVAEFDGAVLPELMGQLAEIAQNMSSLLSVLEGQSRKGDEEAQRALSADGNKLGAVMDGLKAAHERLHGMRSGEEQMRAEFGNSTEAAGGAIGALRDGVDAALGSLRMGMKSGAEGAGSSLSDDISRIRSDGDHIVGEEVAQSTASLRGLSNHTLDLLGTLAGGLAAATEDLKAGQHLLAQESANLTERWAAVKGRIDRSLAKSALADLGALHPHAVFSGAEREMENLLLASTAEVDGWLRSDDEANRREVDRLAAETSRMESTEEAARGAVASVEKLLNTQESSRDIDRLKLFAAGAFNQGAWTDLATILSSRETEEDRSIEMFKQSIEEEVQQVRGPNVEELKDFADGLLVSLKAVLHIMETSMDSQTQQMRSSEGERARELRAKLVAAEKEEIHGLQTIDAREHTGSARLSETLVRMGETLGMLRNSSELLTGGADAEAAGLAEELNGQATTAAKEASKIELDLEKMKNEAEKNFSSDQQRVHDAIANSSVEENASALAKHLADAQKYALELLAERSKELMGQRRQLSQYQSSVAHEEKVTRDLEGQVAESLEHFESRVRAASSNSSNSGAADHLLTFAKDEMEEVANMAMHASQQDEISKELAHTQRQITEAGRNMTATYKSDLSAANSTVLDGAHKVLERIKAEQDEIKAALGKDEARMEKQGRTTAEELHSQIALAHKEM
ncbi:hypothetical protein FOZ63_019501, partial [Perkinsus olseni]